MAGKTLDEMQALIDEMPKGFTLERLGGNRFLVSHRRTGMRGFNTFLALVAVAQVALLIALLAGAGPPKPAAYMAFAFAVTVVWIAPFAFKFFGRRSYLFSSGSLESTQTSICFKQTLVVRGNNITSFQQFQDGMQRCIAP